MFNLIEYLYLKQKNNLVYYDCLTGCKSRLYYDRVAKMKYHGREVDIAFVDVDNLKKINDEQGHTKGSKYLRAVAESLCEIEGAEDVCRIGGDEFVLIGNFTKDNFCNVLSSVSVGIYTKEQYEDLSSAVSKADRKMYDSKEKKKGAELSVDSAS